MSTNDTGDKDNRPAYVPPLVQRLGEVQNGTGACSTGSGDTGNCQPGNNALGNCAPSGFGPSGAACARPGIGR